MFFFPKGYDFVFITTLQVTLISNFLYTFHTYVIEKLSIGNKPWFIYIQIIVIVNNICTIHICIYILVYISFPKVIAITFPFNKPFYSFPPRLMHTFVQQWLWMRLLRSGLSDLTLWHPQIELITCSSLDVTMCHMTTCNKAHGLYIHLVTCRVFCIVVFPLWYVIQKFLYGWSTDKAVIRPHVCYMKSHILIQTLFFLLWHMMWWVLRPFDFGIVIW